MLHSWVNLATGQKTHQRSRCRTQGGLDSLRTHAQTPRGQGSYIVLTVELTFKDASVTLVELRRLPIASKSMCCPLKVCWALSRESKHLPMSPQDTTSNTASGVQDYAVCISDSWWGA